MPKSKRSKVVALTKVKKKDRSAKENLVEQVQEALDTYKNAFVLSFANMRATPFKMLAHRMREDSKFFLGKNKVIQIALGKTPEDEYATNSSTLAKYLRGHVCLLTTNKSRSEAEKFFAEQDFEDFATAGTEAEYTVHLAKGLDTLDGYAHSLEPYLKQLGLPFKLNMQKLELLSDVYVCREGQTLNVEQCKILKLLGYKMGKFKLEMLAHRTEKGKFTEFDAGRVFLHTAEDME